MNTLEELERLLKAGTPGPWEAMIGTQAGTFLRAPNAIIKNDRGPSYATEILSDEDYDTKDADAALIVAAINALPGLLDRVERLEAALVEIKQAAQDFVDLSLPRPSPTSSLDYQAAHATRLAILRAALKEQTP
jgi:hypothetical protein